MHCERYIIRLDRIFVSLVTIAVLSTNIRIEVEIEVVYCVAEMTQRVQCGEINR